jgi:TP901 family phage tail tape measure protein
MGRDFDVNIRINAKNFARKTTKAVLGSLNAIEGAITRINRISESVQQAGIKVQATGKRMVLGTGAAAASFAVLAHQGTKFEDRFARVSTLLDTDAAGAIDRYGSTVENLALDGGKNINSITDALFENISALGESEGTVKFLTKANQAAVGGFTDLSTVTDGVTSILNSYNMAADQGGKIMDQFAIANILGKTTVEDLSASVGRGAALAADANVQNAEFLAGITAITKGGISTSEAVNGLAQAFTNITKPSEQARAIIQEVNKVLPTGLKIDFSVAGLKKLGLRDFLKQLQVIQQADPEAFARLFESKEARVALSILNRQLPTYNTALDRMNKATAEGVLTQTNFNKAVNAGTAPFMRLFRALQIIAIEIWRSVRPAVIFFINILRRIAEVVIKFIQNNRLLVRILAIVAGIFAAIVTAAGLFLIVLGSIIAGIGSMISIAVAGFLASLLIKFFGLWTILKLLFPVIAVVAKIFGLLKAAVLFVAGAIGIATLKIIAIAAAIAAILAPIITFIAGFISGLLDGLAPAIDFILNKWIRGFTIIKTEVIGAAGIVKKFWVGVWEDIKSLITTVLDKIKQFFGFIFSVGRRLGFSLGAGISDLLGAPAIAAAETESKAEESGKKIVKENKKTQSKVTSNMLDELRNRLKKLKDTGRAAGVEAVNIFAASDVGEFLTERFTGEPVTSPQDRGFATGEIKRAAAAGPRSQDNRRIIRIDRVELPGVANVEDFLLELDKLSVSPGVL